MTELTPERVLAGPFDMEVHKATFRNYLEVVILPSGRVCYAVPSHQQWIERYYHETTGRDPSADCPRSRWLDYLDWLIEKTGCVCAWTCGLMGRPNEMQRETIDMLRREGLMYA